MACAGDGFTSDTQNRDADIAAAQRSWADRQSLLRDESLHFVVLDELTYISIPTIWMLRRFLPILPRVPLCNMW